MLGNGAMAAAVVEAMRVSSRPSRGSPWSPGTRAGAHPGPGSSRGRSTAPPRRSPRSRRWSRRPRRSGGSLPDDVLAAARRLAGDAAAVDRHGDATGLRPPGHRCRVPLRRHRRPGGDGGPPPPWTTGPHDLVAETGRGGLRPLQPSPPGRAGDRADGHRRRRGGGRGPWPVSPAGSRNATTRPCCARSPTRCPGRCSPGRSATSTGPARRRMWTPSPPRSTRPDAECVARWLMSALATRGSALAMAQTRAVARALERRTIPGSRSNCWWSPPGGDLDRTTPVTELTELGAFVRAVQPAVLAGGADAAVHSCKDLPVRGPGRADRRPPGQAPGVGRPVRRHHDSDLRGRGQGGDRQPPPDRAAALLRDPISP